MSKIKELEEKIASFPKGEKSVEAIPFVRELKSLRYNGITDSESEVVEEVKAEKPKKKEKKAKKKEVVEEPVEEVVEEPSAAAATENPKRKKENPDG